MRLGAANRSLARLRIPWRFGAIERTPAIARGARLAGVSVAERYRLVAQDGAGSDTLATAAGEPWIVAGPGYVLLGSRLDPAATTLPVRAPFVPWLADVIGLRLAAPPGEFGAPIPVLPGAMVRVPGGADALESPAGARRDASGERITAPAERGVWFILRGGRRVGAIVVNAPPGESMLARWSATALANRLGGRVGARSSGSASAWVADVFASGTRRPALTPLLLLVLLLLAVEAVAVRTTRPSRSTAA